MDDDNVMSDPPGDKAAEEEEIIPGTEFSQDEDGEGEPTTPRQNLFNTPAKGGNGDDDEDARPQEGY